MSESIQHSDPSQSLQRHIDKIDSIVEVDYGDFKRKVNQYLMVIEEQLGAKLRGAQQEILSDIKAKVVYHPEFDIEDGREYTIEQLIKLIASLN